MSSQDPQPPINTEPQDAELYSSWALLILTTLLILTLLSSYLLQVKKIRIIHETVISIFTGMAVGFIIRLTDSHEVQNMVTFKYTYFFNLLLPPIILNSGYELKRQKFFDNLGYILTFAFFGTFISSLVIAVLVYLVVLTGIGGLNLSWVECWIFGSILSSTDPVTIISIFTQLKVEPNLYFIIFGESMLNDSVAIVLFESLHSLVGRELHFSDLIEGTVTFFTVFFGSLAIGVLAGLGTALMLKFTKLHEFPGTEACLITLIAYGTYFFSNAVHMSAIVSLLFCSIILRHYAFDNLSLKSQRSTKYMFQILAQLSENFIFIYLGVTLATKEGETYNAILIIFTLIAILLSRSASIFPISSIINFVVKRLKPYQTKPAIPFNYQVMLFWAGLRGAVSFALAMEVTSPNASLMRSTILIIVVITVVVLGGTTQFAMKRFDIQTGVTDEHDDDSDVEFDYTQFRADESPENHTDPIVSGRPSISGAFTEEEEDRDENWFQSIDDTYLKPIFTKARNSMAIEGTSNQSPTPPLLPSPQQFQRHTSLEIITSDEESNI